MINVPGGTTEDINRLLRTTLNVVEIMSVFLEFPINFFWTVVKW